MNNTHRTIIANAINASKGTFMALTYTKKDGSVRRVNGRLACKTGTVSGVKSELVDPNEDSFIIFDVQNEGYRRLKFDMVQDLTVCGTTYSFSKG